MGRLTLALLTRRSAAAGLALAVAACSGSSPANVASHHLPTAGPTATAVRSHPVANHGLLKVRTVTRRDLGSSWHPGCPVPPSQLRLVVVPTWTFHHKPRAGELVVNVSAVPAVKRAFRSIYRAHYPIRRMVPVAEYGGSDNRSMAHDNTSAFNCRYAVAAGPKHWSEHAYGEAIDINPRENPYRLDGRIYPPSGTSYLDRAEPQRGMILSRGPVVAAFDAVGWGWGGRWATTPDFQHFSVNGR